MTHTLYRGEPMTRREVLIARDAFVSGAQKLAITPADYAAKLAAQRYPLPKTTRPRVVDDPDGRHWQFRVIDGRLECRWDGLGKLNGEWGPINHTLETVTVTPTRVAYWADLFANPTEEVDDL